MAQYQPSSDPYVNNLYAAYAASLPTSAIAAPTPAAAPSASAPVASSSSRSSSSRTKTAAAPAKPAAARKPSQDKFWTAADQARQDKEWAAARAAGTLGGGTPAAAKPASPAAPAAAPDPGAQAMQGLTQVLDMSGPVPGWSDDSALAETAGTLGTAIPNQAMNALSRITATRGLY